MSSEFRIGQYVRNVNKSAFQRRPPDGTASIHRYWMPLDVFLKVTRKPVARGRVVEFAAWQKDEGILGLAESGRRLDQRIEHGLEIEGRAADDLEHVGRSSLLLQRFGEVVEELGKLLQEPRLVA